MNIYSNCWNLDKVKRVHVAYHSDGVINILREMNSNQVVHYFMEEDQFCPQEHAVTLA